MFIRSLQLLSAGTGEGINFSKFHGDDRHLIFANARIFVFASLSVISISDVIIAVSVVYLCTTFICTDPARVQMLELRSTFAPP